MGRDGLAVVSILAFHHGICCLTVVGTHYSCIGTHPIYLSNMSDNSSTYPFLTHLCPPVHYMYRWRAKNSNFFDFHDIFSFGHQMGICAKNYKNLPSRFFMGINGLICDTQKGDISVAALAGFRIVCTLFTCHQMIFYQK